MNIDKDIEIVKEIITHKDDYDVFFGYRIAKPYPVGAEEIQSISTVLSELSNLKWKNEIYVKSIKSHKETIEKKDKELEIWKKIAEKLADKLEQYGFPLIPIRTSENELGLKEPTKEELIDWARKEVENEQNNNT